MPALDSFLKYLNLLNFQICRLLIPENYSALKIVRFKKMLGSRNVNCAVLGRSNAAHEVAASGGTHVRSHVGPLVTGRDRGIAVCV
jgi:hypothetical protein